LNPQRTSNASALGTRAGAMLVCADDPMRAGLSDAWRHGLSSLFTTVPLGDMSVFSSLRGANVPDQPSVRVVFQPRTSPAMGNGRKPHHGPHVRKLTRNTPLVPMPGSERLNVKSSSTSVVLARYINIVSRYDSHSLGTPALTLFRYQSKHCANMACRCGVGDTQTTCSKLPVVHCHGASD